MKIVTFDAFEAAPWDIIENYFNEDTGTGTTKFARLVPTADGSAKAVFVIEADWHMEPGDPYMDDGPVIELDSAVRLERVDGPIGMLDPPHDTEPAYFWYDFQEDPGVMVDLFNEAVYSHSWMDLTERV